MEMKAYKLTLKTYSPVHIGASRELEPTNYVICQESQKKQTALKEPQATITCPECKYKNPVSAKYCQKCDSDLPVAEKPVFSSLPKERPDAFLYTFSPRQLSEALSELDKRQLLNIAKTRELKELKNFFKTKANLISKTATKRAIVAQSIADKYEKGQTDNRFYIEQHISDAVTQQAYIPGSSLKGAIRTALMSLKNSRMSVNKKNPEKDLYGYQDASDDPFKGLKLCDALSEQPFLTEICDVKRKTKKGDIPSIAEIIPENIVFNSSLIIQPQMKPVSFDETIESIRKACNDFYLDVLKNEINRKWKKSLSLFVSELEKASKRPNTFILSIGKHGGAESKTIKGLRAIKNRKTQKIMERSGTFCQADTKNGILPFGWVIVEFEQVR